MNTQKSKMKDNVENFIIEDDALRNLKLRESVFYPRYSRQNYIGPSLLIILGIAQLAQTLYSINRYGDSSAILAISGMIMILYSVYDWHKKGVASIHERIDNLLELYSRTKMRTQDKV